jgi:small subunit ribosomal protein S6
MRPYESMIIFDAELEEPAIASVLDRLTELVRAGGGERGPFDRWGKRAFAYEMKHRREGYYIVTEFTAEPPVAAEIDRLLDLADEVLRHKTMRLPERIKAEKKADRPKQVKAAPQSPASTSPENS